MNIIQEKLINSYVVLVMANQADLTRGIPINEVPEYKKIGGVDYPIRNEVEIKVAEKTIKILG